MVVKLYHLSYQFSPEPAPFCLINPGSCSAFCGSHLCDILGCHYYLDSLILCQHFPIWYWYNGILSSDRIIILKLILGIAQANRLSIWHLETCLVKSFILYLVLSSLSIVNSDTETHVGSPSVLDCEVLAQAKVTTLLTRLLDYSTHVPDLKNFLFPVASSQSLLKVKIHLNLFILGIIKYPKPLNSLKLFNSAETLECLGPSVWASLAGECLITHVVSPPGTMVTKGQWFSSRSSSARSTGGRIIARDRSQPAPKGNNDLGGNNTAVKQVWKIPRSQAGRYTYTHEDEIYICTWGWRWVYSWTNLQIMLLIWNAVTRETGRAG